MKYPSDCESAYNEFGANCGPCSIAAILEKSVHDVRQYLDGFDKRRYMNVTHLKDALDKAGVKYRSIGPHLPEHGLAFIQWSGHDHKPIQAQYRFTHTIAVSRRQDGILAVFEVNAPFLVSWEEWQRIMPSWMQEEKQGDGSFIIRSGLEVILD